MSGSGRTVTHKSKKVCLLGDGAVGKTSLIRRYVLDTFDDKYITTIGTKVSKKVIKYPRAEAHGATELTLMIWDIIGQRGLPQLHSMYFKGASAGFLVCDMTRRPTLEALESWRQEFFSTVGRVPLIVLVNKADLKAQAQMSKDDVARFAKSMGAMYFLTSAKTGMNVEKAFYNLGKIQLDKGAAAKVAAGGGGGGADLTFRKDRERPPDKKDMSEEERRRRTTARKKKLAQEEREKELARRKAAAKKKKVKVASDGGGSEKKKKKKKRTSEDVDEMDFGDLDDEVEDWG